MIAITCLALLSLALVQSNRADYINTLTCDLNPPCKKLPTVNITLSEFASYSPHHELINPIHPNSQDAVGACNTYFRINNSTYIVIRNVNLKNGGTDLQIYIATEIGGQPGSFRLQGLSDANQGNTSVVLNAFIVGSGCESSSRFFLFYTCYLLNTNFYVHPKFDFVYSEFTSPSPPTSCLNQFKQLVDQLGFKHPAGFGRARSLPPCVTKFNNITCLNADKVNSANAICYS